MSKEWENRTPEEQKLIKELYDAKAKFHHKNAYCTTTQELELVDWNGKHPYEENIKTYKVPVGTIMKIVMISRFADIGLTDELNVKYGYKIRVDLDSKAITNIRREQ